MLFFPGVQAILTTNARHKTKQVIILEIKPIRQAAITPLEITWKIIIEVWFRSFSFLSKWVMAVGEPAVKFFQGV